MTQEWCQAKFKVRWRTETFGSSVYVKGSSKDMTIDDDDDDDDGDEDDEIQTI